MTPFLDLVDHRSLPSDISQSILEGGSDFLNTPILGALPILQVTFLIFVLKTTIRGLMKKSKCDWIGAERPKTTTKWQ